jgi:hypothetical protein
MAYRMKLSLNKGCYQSFEINTKQQNRKQESLNFHNIETNFSIGDTGHACGGVKYRDVGK